mmetsp:Transcript_13242/g.22474  ORF Transcript_13242/g.22474 Transcript_13242/m.22474 type:complete len:115 (-) Transcript_13242:34-378(-)
MAEENGDAPQVDNKKDIKAGNKSKSDGGFLSCCGPRTNAQGAKEESDSDEEKKQSEESEEEDLDADEGSGGGSYQFARECYSKEREKELLEFQAKFGGQMDNRNENQDGGCLIF